MTAKEIQKRNVKAENLKVLQSEDGQFFVESEKGKVLYNVVLGDDSNTCTCGDYATVSGKIKITSANISLRLSMQFPERQLRMPSSVKDLFRGWMIAS